MLIHCWGSRGSIPVSGSEYVQYGGDTPCIEIRSKKNDIIIIDTGSGARRLGNKLSDEKARNLNILFTHAHWDHIIGFPFFRPIYNSQTHIEMYGCARTQESVKKIVSEIMKPPYFPVPYNTIDANIEYHAACKNDVQIGTVKITTIPISHPNQGLGYRFEEDGKSFVYLTDNELTYDHEGGATYKDYAAFSKNADIFVHDAEYTREEYKKTKSWGHSVYEDALKLAVEAEVKSFGMFHLNQGRTDKEVNRLVADCKSVLKEKKIRMECFAMAQDWEITL